MSTLEDFVAEANDNEYTGVEVELPPKRSEIIFPVADIPNGRFAVDEDGDVWLNTAAGDGEDPRLILLARTGVDPGKFTHLRCQLLPDGTKITIVVGEQA